LWLPTVILKALRRPEDGLMPLGSEQFCITDDLEHGDDFRGDKSNSATN